MNIILDESHIDRIYKILKDNLIEVGVQSTLLIDTAGHVIASVDNGKNNSLDLYSLAALAAANFAAMGSMAKIVGEDDFSLLFHKGKKESIYFSKVSDDFLLINVFRSNVSLGYLRLKMTNIISDLLDTLQ